MPMYQPQCMDCKHFFEVEGMACSAFPGGIPEKIKHEEFDHTKPWPDADNPQDNGIRYEPLEDFEGQS